jgi:hypothetical protein
MGGVAGYLTDELIERPAQYRHGMTDGRRHKARRCACGWCLAAQRRAAELEALMAPSTGDSGVSLDH